MLAIAGATSAASAAHAGPDAAAAADGSAERANQAPAESVSLDDVLRIAIRANPDLERASIDINAAESDQLRVAGLDDWTFTANGSLSYKRWSLEGVLLPDLAGTKAAEVGAGLARGLEDGGALSLGLSNRYQLDTYQQEGDPEFVDADGLMTAISASLHQPFLRGFGRRIARADRARTALATDIATLRVVNQALDVVRDVVILYWEIVYAAEVRKIRASSLELAVEQRRLTEVAVKAGSVSESELVSIEQAIAVREQAVLLAEIEISERSLDLRRRAGLEVGPGAIDLAPSALSDFQARDVDLDAVLERAMQQNPRLALIQLGAKSADRDVETTEDDTRPRLDVTLSAGLSGRSGKPASVVRQLATVDHPAVQIAVEYEQQLGARAARGATQRARAARHRLDVDLEASKRELAVSVVHAVNLMRTAQKRIDVADKTITLAEKNLQIEQTRFLAGKSTAFLVLTRQDELQTANVSRVRAVVDARSAEAVVLALTGELLEKNHIEVAP